MTPRTFAKAALAIPGTIEAEHMGHPDFRLSGKIFASLGSPNDAWGMVKLTPEEQSDFIRQWPETFEPSAGAWGRKGYTQVLLRSVKTPQLKLALRTAAAGVRTATPRPGKV